MKHLLLILIALTISACSLFDGDEVDLDMPVELQKFQSRLNIDKLWSYNLGSGPDKINPIVVPAIDGERLYVGDHSGSVTAIDLTSGNLVWRTELKNTSISGATGAADGLVVVGTSQGEIVAFNQQDGSPLWRTSVSSEVLAPPATNGDVVIALSIDGKIHGLEATDGSQRWLADTNMPLLSVRGNAAPRIVKALQVNETISLDVAFIGHDNGKVSAYSLADGIQLWEARVGVPEGRTDLERMVDIDGQPLYHSGTLYAVSYQGGLMALQPATGRSVWFQQASSNVGAGAYAGTLVITETDAKVRAFNASSGSELWSSEEYLNRDLNAAAVSNGFVTFADFEGQLHFLDRRSGETIGRVKVDSSGVRSPTILYKDQVIVVDNSGGISAYKVTESGK